jgi:hypothetical protein
MLQHAGALCTAILCRQVELFASWLDGQIKPPDVCALADATFGVDRLDMVEGLTSTVVDHVPGGNYTRQQLTGVLDRIEDATNGVVDAVPGGHLRSNGPRHCVCA